MASSQVQTISSCILRDHHHHNRPERYIESNAHAAMQKNLKDVVKSCISSPPRIPNPKSTTSCNADSFAQTRHTNNNHKNSMDNDKWAKAREIVFQTEVSTSYSEGSVDTRPISSIVKRWKDFEAESKNINVNNANNNNVANPSVCSSRSSSNSTFTENASIVEAPTRCVSESVEEKLENPTTVEDSFMDWESDRTAASGRTSSYSRESNATEKERIRVADIIRKLTSVNGEECGEREQFVESSSLPRVRTSLDHPTEVKCGGAAGAGGAAGVAGVLVSPQRIRGRQAFHDLQMQMERDRHKELEALGDRKSVSKFSHRGRIQALLKVRFLRHELEVKNSDQIISAVSGRNKNSQGSSVTHLREKFNTGKNEHNAVDLSPRKEVINNTQDVEKSSSSNQPKEVVDHIHISENPPKSKQQKDKIPPREVTNVVKETAEVSTCSTSNGLKADINRTPNEGASSVSNVPKKEIQPREVTDAISSFRNIINDKPEVEACSTSNREKVYIKHDDVVMTTQMISSQLKTEDSPKEGSPTMGALWQMATLEVKKIDSEESTKRRKGKDVAERMANKPQSMASLYDWINDISPSHPDWEDEEANKGHLEEPSPDWPSKLPQESSEWDNQSSYQQQLEDQDEQQLETQESEQQQLEEMYYDWITNIARPRSDWEDLRQERYQEMLDPFADNRDIKQLLERKSVSSFLSSGLRDRIDQLMISRTQGQSNIMDNWVEEPTNEESAVREEEENGGNEEHGENEQEEASVETYEEIEEEHQSPITTRQFCEVGEYFDQTPSSSMNSATPSLLRSWSPNRNDDASDRSVHSPSMQKFLSFKSYTQDAQQSSTFRNQQHSSIEMEHIYDLRGHMEQLHHEIFDLRKAIKSCMNMQAKMQHFMNNDPACSASHSAARTKGDSNRVPRKGTCCLCYDSEVDSLLYRCGHICACFKCAKELQWGSGKCPICRAPILDVVRTYTY